MIDLTGTLLSVDYCPEDLGGQTIVRRPVAYVSCEGCYADLPDGETCEVCARRTDPAAQFTDVVQARETITGQPTEVRRG